MKKPCFEKVADRISLLQIPFAGIWVGVYLVQHAKNILIDSGLNAAGADEFILPALNAAGLSATDIDLVLCTHTHGDHLGGHARLKELGVRHFGILDTAVEKIQDPLKYSRLIRSVFPEHSAAVPPVLDGVEPDLVFCDGDIVDGLQAIAAPGHDSDCVCWFDGSTGTLLTGDSIQGNGTATQGCALYMDLPGYRKSLEKLSRMPIQRVVCGHPFYPWLNAVTEGKECIETSLKLIGEYDSFLKEQTSRDPAELSVKLIEHLHGKVPFKLFLAMYTVREHLKESGAV